MATVWLGLGSNLGDRQTHIHEALSSLAVVLDGIVRAPLYESAPQDYILQPDFLNTVIRGTTALTPSELFIEIKKIEQKGGRKESVHPPKGPRTIDIDILLWDDQVLRTRCSSDEELVIPHVSMDKRCFVLKPLLAIDPKLIDPRDGISFSAKMKLLGGQPIRRYRGHDE